MEKYHTLGDREKATRIRDKKLEKEQERVRVKYHKKQTAAGKRHLVGSLKVIQKRGTSFCCDCGAEKKIKRFYAYYDDVGELTKLFPDCKKCNRRKHRSGRFALIRLQRKNCLEHYGHAKEGKLKCASCKNRDFDGLVLFNPRYKNERAIATERTYKKLSNYRYPEIEYKVLCGRCAYKRINSRRK